MHDRTWILSENLYLMDEISPFNLEARVTIIGYHNALHNRLWRHHQNGRGDWDTWYEASTKVITRGDHQIWWSPLVMAFVDALCHVFVSVMLVNTTMTLSCEQNPCVTLLHTLFLCYLLYHCLYHCLLHHKFVLFAIIMEFRHKTWIR